MVILTRKLWPSFLAIALVLGLMQEPIAASANPTPPQITYAIGGNKVGYIEWDQAPNTITQKVLVYNIAGTVVWEMLLGSSQTSFLLGPTDTFANNTTYRAEVQAYVANQWVPSSRADFTPQAAAPSGTTSTSIFDTQGFDQGAQVFFDKDVSAIKYFVGAFPTSSSLTPSRMIEVLAEDVEGKLGPSGVFYNTLTNVDTHFFSVVALNSNGLGSWSPRIGTGVNAYTSPRDYLIKAPTSVSAIAGVMQATVQWSAPSSPSTTIRGYDVQYSTNGGTTWVYERFLSATTTAVIELVEGETPTHFRVAALGREASSGYIHRGASSFSSSPVSPTKRQQMLSWSPSTTSANDLVTGISMQPLATTDSDNLITYSVANSGTAGCSIDVGYVVTATSFGTCRILVGAAESPAFASASIERIFSFVDPNAVENSTSSSSGGGGGGAVPINKKSSAPAVSLGFIRSPSLVGKMDPGSRLTISKFKFDKPKKVLKINYLWYRCQSEVQSSALLGSSCSPRPKSNGRSYVVKKSDLGSYLTVVIKAKTKQGSSKNLLSSKTPVGN
jgi:hypothetical protein